MPACGSGVKRALSLRQHHTTNCPHTVTTSCQLQDPHNLLQSWTTYNKAQLTNRLNLIAAKQQRCLGHQHSRQHRHRFGSSTHQPATAAKAL